MRPGNYQAEASIYKGKLIFNIKCSLIVFRKVNQDFVATVICKLPVFREAIKI